MTNAFQFHISKTIYSTSANSIHFSVSNASCLLTCRVPYNINLQIQLSGVTSYRDAAVYDLSDKRTCSNNNIRLLAFSFWLWKRINAGRKYSVPLKINKAQYKSTITEQETLFFISYLRSLTFRLISNILKIKIYVQEGAKVTWHEKKVKKGYVHPITSHEGPQGKQRYSSTLSLTSTLDGGV
jgi:hypothetical protein